MSNNVRFASTIPPADNDMNGLDSIAPSLIEEPLKPRVVMLVVNAPQSIVNAETGTHLPKLNVIRAEPIGFLDDISKHLKDAMLAAAEQRTGKTPLPLDIVEVVDQGSLGDGED